MKKFKLNLQHLGNAEVLTRSQLKNVLGGGALETTNKGGNYKCCPTGQSDSQFCSSCVYVPAGSHPVCANGSPYLC